PVDGTLADANVTLQGQFEKPRGSGTMRIEQGVAWDEPFEYATSDLKFTGEGGVELSRIVVAKGDGRLTGNANLNWVNDTFYVAAAGEKIALQDLTTFRFDRAPLTGQLSFRTVAGSGSFDSPTWLVNDLLVPDLYAGDEGVGAL